MLPGTSWERSLKYLLSRPRSEKQLREYLDKKGYDQEEIDETLSRLKDANYINDKRFAEGFVRARAQGKLHGFYRLRRDLLQRGVDEKTVEWALAEVFDYVDTNELLDMAVEKWIRTKGFPEDVAARKRLHDYLFRLGYEPGKIMDKLSTLGARNEE